MSEYDYFTATPYVLLCKAEGFFDGLEEEEEKLRHGFWQLHNVFAQKPISKQDFWPMQKDRRNVKKVELSKDEILEILKNNNIPIKNK